MGHTLIVAVIAVVFLSAVSLACLVWPERIQELAVSRHGLVFYNPFKSWVRTRWYLWQLRVIGLVALVIAGVIAWSILRHLPFG